MKKPKIDTQKIHKAHKKLGKPKTLNKAQLEKLVKHFKVKHMFNLEEVIVAQQQDIHHLRNSNKVLHKRINSDGESIDFQRKTIEQHRDLHKVLIDKYEDRIEELEKELQDCAKQRNDSIRAYNGLAQMGKMAEQMGIKLEEACKNLPDNERNKYEFSQKHTVLESGKVKHAYHLKPKKNGKDK